MPDQRLSRLLSVRHLALPLTLFSGSLGLIYQIVWQRYLTVMVGADSRSTAIIVALFLLGLAMGYRHFGRQTSKIAGRSQVLKLYGIVEIGIGAFGILFPFLFEAVSSWQSMVPPYLILDVLFCAPLILPPTFLMGATVPLLTAALPETEDEVNIVHARIYGINTIGAFIGVLVAALWLVPTFGLAAATSMAGLGNLIVGLFFFVNREEGQVSKTNELPKIEHKWNLRLISALVFVGGLSSIALEILWVRIWALSLGSSNLVFPMVLAVFVLGLGLGSLYSPKPSVKSLSQQFAWALIALALAFGVAGYLPIWSSHLRVIIVSHPFAYYFYHVLIFIFMAVVMLPFLIPMGRLLPMSFALMDKDRQDYGQQCGQLYFLNTLGTVAGALILGHAMLGLFSLLSLYKLAVAFIGILGLHFCFVHKRYIQLSFIALALVALIPLGQWDRTAHAAGLFRSAEISGYHFRSLFSVPTEKDMSIEVLMLKDDPISTVAVTKTIGTDNSFSIIVNGKSDSNIVSDGGTIGLFSILPYLSTPTPKDINVAMIGMGTGVSAGLMGTLPGVSRVDLVEISDAVIEAQEILENENFAVMKNPKVIVHKTDAFRFFSHPKGQYDLILSEPSNPWVVGVENLFTGYFYDLVDKSLSENGIFAQWFHLYSISRSEIAAVLANLLAYFPNTEGYTTQTGDLVFLSRKGTGSSPYWNERANHPEIAEYLKRLKIRNAEELKLLKVFGAEELRVATISTSFTPHNLFQPTLSNNAHKSLFLDNSVALQLLLDPFLARVADLPDNREKFDALKTMGTEWFKEYRSYCDDHSGFDPKTSYPVPLCLAIANEMIAIRWFDSNDLELKIKGYSILRKSRLIDKDLALLETAAKAARTVFEKKLEAKGGELLLASIGELIKEGRYERALEIAKENEDILGKQRLSDLSRKALTSKELADKVKGAL